MTILTNPGQTGSKQTQNHTPVKKLFTPQDKQIINLIADILFDQYKREKSNRV